MLKFEKKVNIMNMILDWNLLLVILTKMEIELNHLSSLEENILKDWRESNEW